MKHGYANSIPTFSFITHFCDQATYAIYNGDIYTAYELYTEAKAYSSAHELAITYLAPEAILCDDLDLLSSLFTALDENAIESFGVGGQVRSRMPPAICTP